MTANAARTSYKQLFCVHLRVFCFSHDTHPKASSSLQLHQYNTNILQFIPTTNQITAINMFGYKIFAVVAALALAVVATDREYMLQA